MLTNVFRVHPAPAGSCSMFLSSGGISEVVIHLGAQELDVGFVLSCEGYTTFEHG